MLEKIIGLAIIIFLAYLVDIMVNTSSLPLYIFLCALFIILTWNEKSESTQKKPLNPKLKLPMDNSTKLRLLVIICLFIGVLNLPYFYYQVLRFLVSGTALYSGWLYYQRGSYKWSYTFFLIGILFNPVAPFYLNKQVWIILDIIVAIVIIISLKTHTTLEDHQVKANNDDKSEDIMNKKKIQTPLNAKKLLIIEDEIYIRELYVQALQGIGYEIDEASDGEEGLKKIKEQFYDIIISGIMLPKMDGLSVLEQINKQNIKHGKIIICTNIDQELTINKAINLGVSEYWIKSQLTPTDLLEKVNSL